MTYRIFQFSLVACLIAASAGCGTPEAQKREETAKIAKEAMGEARARIQSLKSGGKKDGETQSPNETSAPD